MLITIPISLFAKKVILSSHGITMTARFPDPIFALTDSDDFFDELRYNRVVLRREKYEEILCDSLTVSTSSVMAQYVGDDLLGVGLRLDKWAKNFMCHAIELGVKSGTGILENVDKFYVAHGIDEWIFSREAAVKRYQRHIQKKTEKYAPKYATADFFVVPKKSHILVKNPEIRCFYLDSELEHFATAYEKKYPSLFRGSRRRAISMAKKQLLTEQSSRLV